MYPVPCNACRNTSEPCLEAPEYRTLTFYREEPSALHRVKQVNRNSLSMSMTLTYTRLFTLLGFCLLLVSCDTFDPGPGQPESEPVKFTTIRQASHSGLSEETTTIIRERDDFEAFWQELHANRKPVPETPSVDFEKKRSEEHTSELQSRGHLVCRLL